jgi:hypothetical protein
MKRILFILLFINLLFIKGFGQNTSVESARVAFLSQKINVTPVQAEKFWPVYNEFHDKRADNRKTIRKLFKMMDEMPDISLEKIKQQINQIASLKSEEINLEKDYYNRCLLIITPKQLADLIAAEREFQKILIKKVSEE